MYPNLNAEMGRKNLRLEDLAPVIGCSVSTLSMKKRGLSPFTLNEAKKIRDYLDTDMSIEELFKEAV